MYRFQAKIIMVGITAIAVLLCSVSVYSQPLAKPETKGKSILQVPKISSLGLRKISLLDPARFTMKHQYMMSFSSISGSGSAMGMYLNTMEYRFNMPLVMRLRVAYQSQSAQLFGNSNVYSGQPNINNGRLFIPSFDIVYKPFKNTVIGLFYRDYSMHSPYYNPYSSYSRYGRYGYNPYMRF